jgi:predicted nucleic acid-binding protein
MGIVVDSSIFIAAERGRFDWIGFHSQIGSESIFLNVITLAELVHGVERADTPARRETRARFVAQIEARYPLLPFEREEALEYARLWAELATRGSIIGTHDQLIAAIARRHGYRVATLNTADFNRVPGLAVLDAGEFRKATA